MSTQSEMRQGKPAFMFVVAGKCVAPPFMLVSYYSSLD